MLCISLSAGYRQLRKSQSELVKRLSFKMVYYSYVYQGTEVNFHGVIMTVRKTNSVCVCHVSLYGINFSWEGVFFILK